MFLYLLCGIPGCGKSSLSARIPGHVISTDRIRKFLWGQESTVKHDQLVFDIARQVIDYLLNLRDSVILDATNLTAAKRQSFIRLGQKHRATVALYWIDCPLETALERNAARERQVPESIIRALNKSFQMPQLREGIDIIRMFNRNLQTVKIITPHLTLKRGKIKLLQK